LSIAKFGNQIIRNSKNRWVSKKMRMFHVRTSSDKNQILWITFWHLI
jgi:hypothetical protein